MSSVLIFDFAPIISSEFFAVLIFYLDDADLTSPFHPVESARFFSGDIPFSVSLKDRVPVQNDIPDKIAAFRALLFFRNPKGGEDGGGYLLLRVSTNSTV